MTDAVCFYINLKTYFPRHRKNLTFLKNSSKRKKNNFTDMDR